MYIGAAETQLGDNFFFRIERGPDLIRRECNLFEWHNFWEN